MSGKFGFNDDELSKLFAAAETAVKKVHAKEGRPQGVEVTAEASIEDDLWARPTAAPKLEAPATRAEARAASGGAPLPSIHLTSGRQSPDALSAVDGAGKEVVIPWKQMEALSAGKLGGQQVLGLIARGTIYYFLDDRMSFKGLVSTLAPSAMLNWRTLASDFLQKTGLGSDPGISALTGAGGALPHYQDLPQFFSQMRS